MHVSDSFGFSGSSQTVFKGITLKPWLKSIEGEAPMFQNLAVFETAYAMALHAGQKQAVVAQNVANADTPGYVARDLPSFREVFAPTDQGIGLQRATRDQHMHGQRTDPRTMMQQDRSFASPDGNTVSLETEMLRGTDAKRQHDRSLAIYRSALTILRTSLGRQ
ncbi:FlgB family protein [Tateyamaria sp. SN6-1]|uniref:FlgB family protein n=1 Tax=Tateyamaria sp. SN6-1 TaxID=3092148 RepID=UPI0039F4FFEA